MKKHPLPGGRGRPVRLPGRPRRRRPGRFRRRWKPAAANTCRCCAWRPRRTGTRTGCRPRGYHLSGYWDANIAYWRANQWLNIPDNRKNLAVIGITPVFRWEADDKLGFYADAGIGASLFSSVYRNTHRQLSTAYEFADHIGAGYVIDNNWEIGARLQHYSNGGIKHPNGGVNLFVLKAAYHY